MGETQYCKANFYDGSKDEKGFTKHWMKGEEYTGPNGAQLKSEGLIGPKEEPAKNQPVQATPQTQLEQAPAPQVEVEPEGQEDDLDAALGEDEAEEEAFEASPKKAAKTKPKSKR
jgi:hypothetical protein